MKPGSKTTSGEPRRKKPRWTSSRTFSSPRRERQRRQPAINTGRPAVSTVAKCRTNVAFEKASYEEKPAVPKDREENNCQEGSLRVRKTPNVRTYARKPEPTSMVTLAMPPGLFDRTDDVDRSVPEIASSPFGAQDVPPRRARRQPRSSSVERPVHPVLLQECGKPLTIQKSTNARTYARAPRRRPTLTRIAETLARADVSGVRDGSDEEASPCTATLNVTDCADALEDGRCVYGVGPDVNSSDTICSPVYRPCIVLTRIDPEHEGLDAPPQRPATGVVTTTSHPPPASVNVASQTGVGTYDYVGTVLEVQSGGVVQDAVRSTVPTDKKKKDINLQPGARNPKDLLLPKVGEFNEFGEVDSTPLEEEEEDGALQENAQCLIQVARKFLDTNKKARERNAPMSFSIPRLLQNASQSARPRMCVVRIPARYSSRIKARQTVTDGPIGGTVGPRCVDLNGLHDSLLGTPTASHAEDVPPVPRLEGKRPSGRSEIVDVSGSSILVPLSEMLSAASGVSKVPVMVLTPVGSAVQREAGRAADTVASPRIKTEPMDPEEGQQELFLGTGGGGSEGAIGGRSRIVAPDEESGRATLPQLIQVKVEPEDYTYVDDDDSRGSENLRHPMRGAYVCTELAGHGKIGFQRDGTASSDEEEADYIIPDYLDTDEEESAGKS